MPSLIIKHMHKNASQYGHVPSNFYLCSVYLTDYSEVEQDHFGRDGMRTILDFPQLTLKGVGRVEEGISPFICTLVGRW